MHRTVYGMGACLIPSAEVPRGIGTSFRMGVFMMKQRCLRDLGFVRRSGNRRPLAGSRGLALSPPSEATVFSKLYTNFGLFEQAVTSRCCVASWSGPAPFCLTINFKSPPEGGEFLQVTVYI